MCEMLQAYILLQASDAVEHCCKQAEVMVALLHCGEDGFPDAVIGQIAQRISKGIQRTRHDH